MISSTPGPFYNPSLRPHVRTRVAGLTAAPPPCLQSGAEAAADALNTFTQVELPGLLAKASSALGQAFPEQVRAWWSACLLAAAQQPGFVSFDPCLRLT